MNPTTPSPTPTPITISDAKRKQIAEILNRRSNEIASYQQEHSCEAFPNKVPLDQRMPASVEFALTREIKRLRELAELVAVPPPPEPADDE